MPIPRLTFPRSHRLTGKLNFKATYDAGVHESRGPLRIFARPNDLAHARLGLSVSRRVGNAPRRNLIKRRLREAFRLLQHDFPRGYDLIIVVRPHEPLLLADYQRLLSSIMVKLHTTWLKREQPKPD
ncbi:MAG: ribonuclease P protein component [Anaerolineae bacterium]|nr:ribonuclease P protein component [Phycisphaerae bacterium]